VPSAVKHIVFDPVMIATSGDRLLQDAAITALKQHLIPMASLITPNLMEATVLLGCPTPETSDAMEHMVEPLMALGCQAVLIKGGHLKGEESTDILGDGGLGPPLVEVMYWAMTVADA
jgi:hydroxymethylpyrimidine/phosphomethylpyrimidine kinase